MTKGVEKTGNYRSNSDWGKLKLAGEVVISYVGTEAGKDNNSDVVVDAEIGGHNLTNANKLVFNDWEHELEVKQYDQGEAFYEKVKQYADGKTVSITGHSLGGGIANTVALRHQDDDNENIIHKLTNREERGN